jgi:hypothetical protein
VRARTIPKTGRGLVIRHPPSGFRPLEHDPWYPWRGTSYLGARPARLRRETCPGGRSASCEAQWRRSKPEAGEVAPLRVPRTATQGGAGLSLLTPPPPPGSARRNANTRADEGKRTRFRNGNARACQTDHISAHGLSHCGAHDHNAELHQRRYERCRPNMLRRSVRQLPGRLLRFRMTSCWEHHRPPRTEPGVASRRYFEHAHTALPNGLRLFVESVHATCQSWLIDLSTT